MTEEKLKILLPPEKIVRQVAEKNPSSGLSRMIELFGPSVAARIMTEFAGRMLYLPTNSTLYRSMVAAYVKEELKGLKPGSPKYQKQISKLAHLFKKEERSIIRIHKSGRYE